MEKQDNIEEELTMDDYLNYMDGFDDVVNDEEYEIMLEDNQHQRGKSDSSFSVDNTISIDRFVNEYLEVSMDCKDLWHSGLKELKSSNLNTNFMYAVGVDNEFANKNRELVYQGYLLLVIDNHGRGKRGTYINPIHIKNYLSELPYIDKKEERAKELNQILESIDLTEIKDEEKYNRNIEYLSITREIEEFKKIEKIINISGSRKKINEIKEKVGRVK